MEIFCYFVIFSFSETTKNITFYHFFLCVTISSISKVLNSSEISCIILTQKNCRGCNQIFYFPVIVKSVSDSFVTQTFRGRAKNIFFKVLTKKWMVLSRHVWFYPLSYTMDFKQMRKLLPTPYMTDDILLFTRLENRREND